MIILVATPQYLTRYGAPESPDDLHRFRAVVFVERGSVQPWSFGSGREMKRVILAVRPASRRMSTKVRIFIEHLEKTFAFCSQFNPLPS